MSKTLLGLLVGTLLGLIDGATAIFSPAVHSLLLWIVIASTMKGFATGLIAGFVARRTNSIKLAILSGLGVGLILSFIAAVSTPDPEGHRYYLEIMLPGGVLGIVAGYCSQRFGTNIYRQSTQEL